MLMSYESLSVVWQPMQQSLMDPSMHLFCPTAAALSHRAEPLCMQLCSTWQANVYDKPGLQPDLCTCTRCEHMTSVSRLWP